MGRYTLTYEHNGDTVTIDFSADTTLDTMFEKYGYFLLACGFHPNGIKQYFQDKEQEYIVEDE